MTAETSPVEIPPAARPGSRQAGEVPAAPSGLQLDERQPTSGPNPWLVIALAFILGLAVAKVVDWRGHAHPRS